MSDPRKTNKLHTVTNHVLRFGLLLLLAVLLLLVGHEVLARPGGGHTFSRGSRGGGSWGGGGGGGGDAGIIFLLIRLILVYPEIGVPLLIVAGVWFYLQKRRREQSGWSTTTRQHMPVPNYRPVPAPAPSYHRSPRRRLEGLRKIDPDFSMVLFDDFVYALFSKTHEARGSGQLETLSAYLSESARHSLQAQTSNLSRVHAVVIGAMAYLDVRGVDANSSRARVLIEFEANYTEESSGAAGRGVEQSYYSVERWELERNPKAKSRTPEKVRVFGCPSCGAPLQAIRGNTCSYCNNIVDTGEFDWLVASIHLVSREQRGPQLTGDVSEEGTRLPTLSDPEAPSRLQALVQRDPALDWGKFQLRLELIFQQLQPAWSTRDWMKARPYVSDGLFQSLQYWIESYKKAGLSNITEKSHIRKIELVAVGSDRYYDAITARVHAEGLDYTISDSGKVVSGSRSRPRRYSEYWTLIRGRSTRGAPRSDTNCPSCGAPVKVNMAGSCEYCSAKVTSGDFDWILSRIEQDEAYQG